MAVLYGVWMGGAGMHNRVNATIIVTGGNASVRLRVYPAAGGAMVAESPAVQTTASSSRYDARVEVTGLAPNTAYVGRAVLDGVEAAADSCSFRTAPTPGASHSFLVAFGSCADTPVNTAYDRLADKGPTLLIHTGDLNYSDIGTLNTAARRNQMQTAVAGSAGAKRVFGGRRTFYTWSDHDAISSADKELTVPGIRASCYTAYRTTVPHPLEMRTAANETPDAAFTEGRVRFIAPDCRTARVPGQYRIEAAQMAWLKAEILAAGAAGRAIGIVSETQWIAPSENGDHWGGVAAQRKELADFIDAAGLNGHVFWMAGDMHGLAYDDGRNNRYATSGASGGPVMQAAPFHRGTSVKGGPYSSGTWAPSGVTGEMYGTLEVQDTGGDLITFIFRGYDNADTLRFEETFTRSAVVVGEGPPPDPDPDPDPVSFYVLEQRDRAAGSSTWIALPTLDLGTPPNHLTAGDYTRNLTNTAPGLREYQCRTRDTLDDAVSPWVSRTYEVKDESTEPPPDPTPEGAWFSINGVEFEILAEGVRELEPELASGELVRAFDGTMLSTADGELRRWSIPLLELGAADHAVFRAERRRQRRVTAGGFLFGSPLSAGFLATVELERDAYLWEHDGGFTRLPVVTVRAVDVG